MTGFTSLGLAAPILRALETEKYETPTPIQSQAIPHVLAGKDLLGVAQTGTGKTAAFALPMLQRLAADKRPIRRGQCRALILSPTRELASQIAESFRTYGRHMGLSTTVIFGGVSAHQQVRAMTHGVDILVATPGRLLDHVNTRAVQLDAVEIFVLDEADRMLDMGFINDIRRLVRKLPSVRQNLFFSATMPSEIGKLAGELLKDPVRVSVTPVASTAERIDQRVIFIEASRKASLLAEILRDANEKMTRTLVFTRTKRGADKAVRQLANSGIDADAIHGNKSQNQRERALDAFRSGRTRILVATDIAARGIDVDGISHVVNYDLPNVPESYVHRIGRTARAGAEGIAISFCDGEEREYLRDIEKLTRQRIPTTDRRGHGALAGAEPDREDRGERSHRGGQRPSGGRPQHKRQSSGQPRGDYHGGKPSGGHRQRDDRPRDDRPRDDRPSGHARPDYRADNRGNLPGPRAEQRPQQQPEHRSERRPESRPDSRPEQRNERRHEPRQGEPMRGAEPADLTNVAFLRPGAPAGQPQKHRPKHWHQNRKQSRGPARANQGGR
ncbi:MAG: DEAD/DEAH box helicase [Alphaproteobacteria bacterium]